MRRLAFRSVVYYQFEHTSQRPALVHGLFTRLGGYSVSPWASLNTGHSVSDDPQHVDANHQLIAHALQIDPSDVVSPYQVHGKVVRVVDDRDRGTVIEQTDALVTGTAGVFLFLRFADCVPVLFYDPVRGVVGLAHAGWRGTVAGIVSETVACMRSHFGCRPPDILAGIGPSIGPCCYEVGQDVADAVGQSFAGAPHLLEARRNGRWHFDLWAANAHLLERCGVSQIEIARTCTACRTDEWFSHRAEHGRTGRWAAVIGLRRD